MSMSLPVSLGGPTRAAKPERHTVASLFAKATTKLGLATAVAALWLIVVPIAGAAADVQISAARAAALKVRPPCAVVASDQGAGKPDGKICASRILPHDCAHHFRDDVAHHSGMNLPGARLSPLPASLLLPRFFEVETDAIKENDPAPRASTVRATIRTLRA